MANSYSSYPGDGSTTDFSLTFSYLNPAHVSVAVDEIPTAFIWVNSTTVRVTPAPSASAVVVIKRATPSTPIVDYANGAILFDTDLDTSQLQAIFIAEEARDSTDGFLGANGFGNYDIDGFRVVNMGAPVNPGDAVRKADLDAQASTLQAIADGAAASASAASTSQGAAASSASAASSSASAAAASATAAAASAVEAAAVLSTSAKLSGGNSLTGNQSVTGNVTATGSVSGATLVAGGNTVHAGGRITANVNFNGTGTVAIKGAKNVSSITDNGAGDYWVNFTVAEPDTNYTVSPAAGSLGTNFLRSVSIHTKETGRVRIIVRDASGPLDADDVNVTVIR